MTNQLAIFLAVVIIAALGIDLIWLDSQGILLLLRKFLVLIEWLAIWR